jgi:hypothetical protein
MLNHESARLCFESISQSSLNSLRHDLVRLAVAYAQIRAKWYMMGVDEKRDADSSRTASHNAFIDACNILSRNQAKIGEDNSWRETLGDDRKVIGDFACYVHLFVGLSAR